MPDLLIAYRGRLALEVKRPTHAEQRSAGGSRLAGTTVHSIDEALAVIGVDAGDLSQCHASAKSYKSFRINKIPGGTD